MDEYGYGAAIKTGLQFFETASRQSGRTTRLLERVKDGDRIIVSNPAMGQLIQGKLAQLGKRLVQVLVVPIDGTYPPRVSPRMFGVHSGRTYFEHTWTLEFYKNLLKQTDSDWESFAKAYCSFDSNER